MAWRRILSLIVMLTALAGCGRSAAPPKVVRVRPKLDVATLPFKYKDHNLVFVSFDALQAAHVGCLGYPRDVTPTIDAVAEEGFNFTRTYSVASWTVPASMTWFTGVYPSEHGMTNKFALYQPPLQKLARLKETSPNLVTLAQILKDAGYATGGFTGNAGVSAGFGYEQGFDEYYHEKNTFGRFDRSVPEAVNWLKARKDHKFFLFLHGYDVHGQSSPPEGYDYRFVDKRYDRRYTGSSQEQETLREAGLDKGRLNLRDSDVRFWRAIYDEKIQRADQRFKQFLKEFEQLGLTERTLFVLTSDHGTEFHEHGRFDHGFSLYSEQLHVPLIIKLPGQSVGATINDRISSIDLMPTILELLDLAPPAKTEKQLRGTSLVAAMKGKPARRDVFAETDYRQMTYQRCLITPDGWKLICTLENNTREMFDLGSDPGETIDLSTKFNERADELQARLYAHFKAIGHDLTAKRWIPGFNPVYTFPGMNEGK